MIRVEEELSIQQIEQLDAEPSLIKWPGLLVAGERQFQDDASEIILRTDSGYLSTNDREWEGIIYRILGKPGPYEYDWDDDTLDHYHHACDVWKKHFPKVDLSYLGNDRIASSWIGGPKGWMNWGGAVCANNYNIGKWPCQVSVIKDAINIARAFPKLKMKMQLLPHEAGFPMSGGGNDPVLTIEVEGGEVTYTTKAVASIIPDVGLDVSDMSFGDPLRERGCTADMLQQAMDHLRSKFPDISDQTGWND